MIRTEAIELISMIKLNEPLIGEDNTEELTDTINRPLKQIIKLLAQENRLNYDTTIASISFVKSEEVILVDVIDDLKITSTYNRPIKQLITLLNKTEWLEQINFVKDNEPLTSSVINRPIEELITKLWQ